MNLVNNYIIKNKYNKFLMDSIFIINNQWIDYINFNKQILKHKVSKLSLITYIKELSLIKDIKELPLNIYLAEGNKHDAKIIIKQLDNFINNTT